MKTVDLTCFKAYDIRGEINVNIDEGIVYRIGRAVAQHFRAKSVVVGYDARETSPAFAEAIRRGVLDAGAEVINIGLAGTEEMYWAVTEFGACAGIEITASHNPINYNGIKIVKSFSRPLDNTQDFKVIKRLAESQNWSCGSTDAVELNKTVEARDAYVNRVLRFVDTSALKPLNIVVNSGNGSAGPTFDAIAKRLSEQKALLEFVRVDHSPDHTFPNGIPNPLLPANRAATADVVKKVNADFGVAFDGDFDRCFFFDENGRFVSGEYVVGLLASIFLKKERGAKIVHDPRVIWNTQGIVASEGGVAIQSKTGHAFVKQTMRENQAVYGGEISAHHYFRDFAYCDSGMIPWLLVAELISKSGRSLGDLVSDRFERFPSSGECNFKVIDADASIAAVVDAFKKGAAVNDLDGVSLSFQNWRFNLRKSNTEPLVRLNVETRGNNEDLQERVASIVEILTK